LNGELLERRPLLADGFAALYTVASYSLFWEQHSPKNPREAAVFRRFFDDEMKFGCAILAVDKESMTVIDSSRYHA
jgi:hypothetical protein